MSFICDVLIEKNKSRAERDEMSKICRVRRITTKTKPTTMNSLRRDEKNKTSNEPESGSLIMHVTYKREYVYGKRTNERTNDASTKNSMDSVEMKRAK